MIKRKLWLYLPSQVVVISVTLQCKRMICPPSPPTDCPISWVPWLDRVFRVRPTTIKILSWGLRIPAMNLFFFAENLFQECGDALSGKPCFSYGWHSGSHVGYLWQPMWYHAYRAVSVQVRMPVAPASCFQRTESTHPPSTFSMLISWFYQIKLFGLKYSRVYIALVWPGL